MENELDDIAGGDAAALDFLRAFYFGSDGGRRRPSPAAAGSSGWSPRTSARSTPAGINSIPLFRDDAGRDVVVRVGRYGPYLQRTVPGAGDRPAEGRRRVQGNQRRPGSLPDGIAPDELTPEKVDELFLGGGGERKLGEHPETGEPIVLKSGRYGPYVTTGEKNASLLSRSRRTR